MALTSTGIGSGINVSSLVSSLVQAEAQPAQLRLDRREADIQTKLSALGSLKSALSDFKSALGGLKDLTTFQARTAISANVDIFTASATSSAVPASYGVEVRNLAQSQKLSAAPLASASSVLGEGALTLSIASGASFNITIDSSNSTLEGVRDAINKASGNSFVTATIVNGDAGATLVLSARNPGAGNALSVSAVESGAPGLGQLNYPPGANGGMSEIQGAKDAVVVIDGQTVSRSTNTITDAIAGVTLDLKKAAPGDLNKITIGENRGAVTSKVNGFIDAYNKLESLVKTLSSYDPETKSAGALLGDATLRSVVSQLRTEMGQVVQGASADYPILASIGITSQRDGKFTLDSAKLNKAMDANFDNVGKLFAGDQGFATRADKLLEGYVGSTGVLTVRTDGLNDSLKRINKDREVLQIRLQALEKRYLAQFNAMDAMVGQMQALGSYLTQQLANLPDIGGSNK